MNRAGQVRRNCRHRRSGSHPGVSSVSSVPHRICPTSSVPDALRLLSPCLPQRAQLARPVRPRRRVDRLQLGRRDREYAFRSETDPERRAGTPGRSRLASACTCTIGVARAGRIEQRIALASPPRRAACRSPGLGRRRAPVRDQRRVRARPPMIADEIGASRPSNSACRRKPTATGKPVADAANSRIAARPWPPSRRSRRPGSSSGLRARASRSPASASSAAGSGNATLTRGPAP